MKNTRKTMAFVMAAVMGLSALPAMNVSAEDGGTAYPEVTYVKKQEAEFVVIMWSENEDGEITITGCSPMYSEKVADYPTPNVLCSFMYKHKLELPSHINGKPVVAIDGVNIAKAVGAKTVVINENITEISNKAFGKGVTILTTDKELKMSPIYY